LSRCPTFNFQISIISKWLAKHISTKVTFKIIIRKRHVYFDIGWPSIWNHCFYLGIWNINCTKNIVLPSFLFATQLNSQNTNETVFTNVTWHINLLMKMGISNSHNWCFFFKSIFLTLFQFLTQLLNSKHLKLFSI
jgi:hypothetical protein